MLYRDFTRQLARFPFRQPPHVPRAGFTVVELLIVIVVIGVLATIVLIAYGNVRGQAHDVVVKKDLSNIRQKLGLYKAQYGSYPKDNAAELSSRGMGVAKESYDTNNAFNLAYCYDFATDNYIVSSLSRSGKKYAIGSAFTTAAVDSAATKDGLSASSDCSDIRPGYTRLYAGYDKNDAYNGYVPGDTVPWRQWVLSPAQI